jgi:hypothetical protein
MEGPLDRLERVYGDRLGSLGGESERSLSVIFWSAVAGPFLFAALNVWWTGLDPNLYLIGIVAIPFMVVARVAWKRRAELRSLLPRSDVAS